MQLSGKSKNSTAGVNLACVVNCFSAFNAVRLCLCLKAECSVLNLLNAALEIGAVSKEVSYVELNSLLIGINVKR